MERSYYGMTIYMNREGTSVPKCFGRFPSPPSELGSMVLQTYYFIHVCIIKKHKLYIMFDN